MDTPIDSRQLKAFVTLARTGSYTSTAGKLFLTQSAISHSIKALERDLGCSLLRKVGKNLQLTPAGEQLLSVADDILAKMRRAREVLSNVNEWEGGRLRMGAGPTACQYILPTVLREFRECYPKSEIILKTGDTPAALESLVKGDVDIAFVLQPERKHPIEFNLLFEDELRFLVSPLHPWAVRGRVERKQISDEPFIFYNRNSYTFRMITRYFREEGITIQSSLELGSTEAIKELLKISLGIGVLAPWVAKQEIAEGSLVSMALGRRRIKRQWGIAYASGRKLTLAEETFVGICEATCRNLLGSQQL